MLDALRASSQTWIGRIIMALVMGFLILAFGFWGIGDIFRGFGANQLARVGSTEITIDAYRLAYQNELLRLQQQQRRAITSDEARQMGLDRQVLQRLVENALLDQEAHRLGLAMSDQDLAKRIVEDDSFKGVGGQFDRQVFKVRLSDAGLTERGFETQQRGAYLRAQMLAALNDGLATPKAMLELINRYYNETRSIDYIVLPKSAAGDPPLPSDAELKAYFDARRDAYRTPEYRKIVALVMTPNSLAESLNKTDPISDAEVEKRYEAVKGARYTQPQHRHIEQIVFPNEAAANDASAKLANGETFDARVAERKLTPKDIDLGIVTKTDLADPAIADAAFALPAGGVSKPVKTQFGWVILRAEKIIPQIVLPLFAVKPTLAAELALERAKSEISKIHDQIEDQRTAGKSIAEAAKAIGLEVRTIDAIDANGRDKTGHPVPDLGDPAALVKALFASDVGVDNDAIDTSDGGSVWFDILGIEPARAETFDEVKKQVAQAWTEDEMSKRLSAKAADLIHKLNHGETLNAVAASQGNLGIKHIDGIKRSDSQGLSRDFLALVFNRGVGTAGSAALADGGRALFKVTDAKVPPLDVKSANFHNIIGQMKTALDGDMVAQYVGQLAGEIGVGLNQQALQSILGAPTDTE
jgi:peptidyl-prolyl cis-trans isomerase D